MVTSSPHTDPRLTAGVYTDEKLLPLAAELLNVPAIPTGDAETVPAGALRALFRSGRRGSNPRHSRWQRDGRRFDEHETSGDMVIAA